MLPFTKTRSGRGDTIHSMSPRAPNIADKIFEDLKHQILAGTLPAGSRLPGERDLAKRFNTNRNTLREAVRMLEQSDLVTVRHGQGVTIADFRHTGTLDLLAPFLQAAPDPMEVANIVKDVLEPRTLFLEYATALAARRATASMPVTQWLSAGLPTPSSRPRARSSIAFLCFGFSKRPTQIIFVNS